MSSLPLLLVWVTLNATGPQPEAVVEPPTEALVEQSSTLRNTTHRSGLYGAGVGLELPMVGIGTGAGTTSVMGVGYQFGGSLLWEFMDRIAIRLQVSGGESFGSRVWLQYQESGELVRSEQDASWFGLEGCVGATYLWRGVVPAWVPYVGLDLGPHFHGYIYRFDESLEKIEGVEEESGNETRNHNSVNLDFKVNLRAGVRMEMLSWLGSSVELNLGYTRLADAGVTGTLAAREVQAEPEGLWTFRLLYSVYLGL
jgi:hypothetical protein